MNIKLAEDIVKEMEERGVITIPQGCVTGEDFEEWLCEKSSQLNRMVNMKKYYVWHNTRGMSDEYFIVNKSKSKVLWWRLPKFIGRLLCK